MADDNHLKEIRRQLALLARRKNARFAEFSRESPTRWEPGRVIDPATSLPFSPSGAWEFIADVLEAGAELYQIELERPPGAVAYYFTVACGKITLYVKLQLGAGNVIGRSFHCSDRI